MRDKALVTTTAARANHSRSSSEDSNDSEQYIYTIKTIDNSNNSSDHGSNHGIINGSNHGFNHSYILDSDSDVVMSNTPTKPKRIISTHATTQAHTRAKNNAQNTQNKPHNEPIAIHTKRAKSIGSQTPSRRLEYIALKPRNRPPQLTKTLTKPQ